MSLFGSYAFVAMRLTTIKPSATGRYLLHAGMLDMIGVNQFFLVVAFCVKPVKLITEGFILA
jgi:hypothetical protein